VRLAILLALAGCDGGQSGENLKAMPGGCQPLSSVTVEPTDDTLGFSAEELLANLPLPNAVEWGATLDGADRDPLAFDGLAIDGAVRIVELGDPTPDCALGAGSLLVVPVSFDVDLGDGAATGRGTVELWAADLTNLEALAESATPLTLAGSYGDAFDAWLAEPGSPGRTPGFEVYGPWAALRVAIVADGSDGATVLWDGAVDFP
jgi:hypothetical protein